MFEIDKEKARKILISELGYSPSEVDSYLENYPLLHDKLAEAVDRWLEDRSILDVKVEGISIQEVMKKRRSSFLAAIRDLNFLLNQDLPEDHRQSIIRILKKPVVRM